MSVVAESSLGRIGDIIHAVGVGWVGARASSTRQAWGPGSVSAADMRETSESVVEVGEVAVLQRRILELFEDGQDVVERPDGGQRRGFWGALKAAQCGQAESRFDELDGDASSFEVLGEVAIGWTGACCGLRQGAVKAQDALDVGGHGCGCRSEGPSMRRVWQRCRSRLSRDSSTWCLPRKWCPWP